MGIIQSNFITDWREDGKTLVEDTPLRQEEFLPSGVKAINLLKEEERSISGGEFVKRAKGGVCLGQRHAEAFQKYLGIIGSELGEGFIAFPGTVWLDDEGLYIPCLCVGRVHCSLILVSLGSTLGHNFYVLQSV